MDPRTSLDPRRWGEGGPAGWVTRWAEAEGWAAKGCLPGGTRPRRTAGTYKARRSSRRAPAGGSPQQGVRVRARVGVRVRVRVGVRVRVRVQVQLRHRGHLRHRGDIGEI